MNGLGAAAHILGINPSPSEEKLLLMKKDAVKYYRAHPKEYAELKRIRSEVEARHMHIRIGTIPAALRDCLKKMDGSGLPSETRALVSMVMFQIDSVIEELEGDGQ